MSKPVTCQAPGCTKPADRSYRWQTATMPAPAFLYTCQEHKEWGDRIGGFVLLTRIKSPRVSPAV